MRLMITGGAGFIGSNLILYWLENYPEDRIVNFDSLTYAGNLTNLQSLENHPHYCFVKGDLCSADEITAAFEQYHIEAVIHLAAESHVDRSIAGPGQFIHSNVIGTYHLLEAAKHFWTNQPQHRFHHVSTDEVYGSLGKTGHFSETTPYAPNSPYSASKAASDHLVRAYHHTYGLNVTTSNCSNNYGPFQFPEKLLPLLIKNCLEQLPIPVYGDGSNIRDWLYVTDHCRAIDTVFHQGKSGETYNIGGLNEWRNIDIVRYVCRTLDEILKPSDSCEDLISFVNDRPGHDQRYAIDASKIKQELNWTPLFSFEDGIKTTISWYLEHQDWVQQVTTGEYQQYYAHQYGNRV